MSVIRITITKKEILAIRDAAEMVNNLLEGCTANEETEDGKRTIKMLNDTISGLFRLSKKYRTQKFKTQKS